MGIAKSVDSDLPPTFDVNRLHEVIYKGPTACEPLGIFYGQSGQAGNELFNQEQSRFERAGIFGRQVSTVDDSAAKPSLREIGNHAQAESEKGVEARSERVAGSPKES